MTHRPCRWAGCSRAARLNKNGHSLGRCDKHLGAGKGASGEIVQCPCHGREVYYLNGYARLVNRKEIAEHTAIMEDVLGRALRPGENVHHKNGIKNDNRPENLELWVKQQPAGQRVKDLIEFVVTYYPTETQIALNGGYSE